MKQYNKTWVTLSWLTTGVATLGFIFNMAELSKVHTKYGSPATSFPVAFGVILLWFTIPLILWIITFLTKNNEAHNSSTTVVSKFKDIEFNSLEMQFQDSIKKQEELREKFKTIKSSFEQGLIDNVVYTREKNYLEACFRDATAEKEKAKKRYNVILSLKDELQNLEKLVADRIITREEAEKKRNELIRNRM